MCQETPNGGNVALSNNQVAVCFNIFIYILGNMQHGKSALASSSSCLQKSNHWITYLKNVDYVARSELMSLLCFMCFSFTEQ